MGITDEYIDRHGRLSDEATVYNIAQIVWIELAKRIFCVIVEKNIFENLTYHIHIR